MKIPLSWLNEFLTLNISVEKIAEALTLAGIEVEKIETIVPSFEGVVVATVISVQPHPNADRLRVAQVFDGQNELQIVCGASNCRPGIKTALAKIGAKLTDKEGKSFTIKKGKLRDVESFGMLCAGDELGLASGVEGILELSSELKEGVDLASLYRDTVLEVGLTPNLGHCLSILGIARELSAILSLPLKSSPLDLSEASQPLIQDLIEVQVENRDQCPFYSCRVIQGVTVGPSPDWMQRRLEAAGMRSINNLVDVGNFVMLELGLPLHMFDYDTLVGKKIVVSSNKTYPVIETLDGVTRPIPSGTLLICDSENPIAIAGIMGGEGSAVSPKTQNVLIEAAYFMAEPIRKASKALNLRTEGSQRWEKGVDPKGVRKALNRAAALLQQCAGGILAQGVLVAGEDAFSSHEISLRIERVNALLGTSLSRGEIISLLERLEIKVKDKDQGKVICEIPSYRNDLKIEIDLIEEVARLYGFNHIPQHPPRHLNSPIPHAPIYLFEKEMRGYLIELGLQECLTCDLISPKLAELTGENNQSFITVLHPTSIEQSILRVSLLPGLLQVIKYNQDHQNTDFSAFELGRIHYKEGDRFIEQTSAGVILVGHEAPHHWECKPKEIDYYDLKGKVEELLELLGIKGAHFEPSHLHNFHPFRQARVKVNDLYVGALGEIHPSHLREMGIQQRVYFAELNLHDLFPLRRTEMQFREISLYPGSERDWTISLKEETPIAYVLEAVRLNASSYLEKYLLLDLYRSPQLGEGKKNATMRFLYRDLKKTIEFEIVEREHKKLIQLVAEKLADHIL
jgi:phenylalanyl-tRNA synthetase beta chain